MILAAFFAVLMLLWLLLQLFALTIYPRLEVPTLGIALQQAGLLILTQPAVTILATLLVLILVVVGWWLPIVGLSLSFSAIAVLANQTTRHLLDKKNNVTIESEK